MDIKWRETTARISRAHPPIDFFKISGFPNYIDGEHTYCPLPILRGHDNNHSARFHVMIFLSWMSEFNICHENNTMLMFSHSLQGIVSCWFYEGLPDKSITSLPNSLEIFLRQWRYDENDIELFIKTNLDHFFPWKEYHVEEPELTSINMANNT